MVGKAAGLSHIAALQNVQPIQPAGLSQLQAMGPGHPAHLGMVWALAIPSLRRPCLPLPTHPSPPGPLDLAPSPTIV